MARESARDRILEAALAVALREGAGNLTLDSVAAEAQVSKGGLLYHFPDKQSLLTGVLEAALQRFDGAMQTMMVADTHPGSAVRAYAAATDEPAAALPELFPALFAASALSPELLQPAREHFERWQARMDDDGVDPVDATLVRLAADGLWLSDAYGLAPVTGDRRRQVLQRLAELAGGRM